MLTRMYMTRNATMTPTPIHAQRFILHLLYFRSTETLAPAPEMPELIRMPCPSSFWQGRHFSHLHSFLPVQHGSLEQHADQQQPERARTASRRANAPHVTVLILFFIVLFLSRDPCRRPAGDCFRYTSAELPRRRLKYTAETEERKFSNRAKKSSFVDVFCIGSLISPFVLSRGRSSATRQKKEDATVSRGVLSFNFSTTKRRGEDSPNYISESFFRSA